MDDQEVTYPIYSPASVIGIFSNALKLNATVNLIYLKGRYAFGGGKSYGTIIMTFCSQKVIILRLGFVFLRCSGARLPIMRSTHSEALLRKALKILQ